MGGKLQTVYVRTLWRALEILGGKEELCRALGVAMRELELWLDGRREPPIDMFLKAVDILSRPTEPTPPKPIRARAAMLASESRRIMADSMRLTEQSRALREAWGPARAEMPRVRRFLDGWFDAGERAPMLTAALDAALEAGGAPMGNVQLQELDGLHIVAQQGFKPPFLEFFACVTDGQWACGSAERTAQRTLIADVAADYRFVGTAGAAVMEAAHARAVQSTPLVSVSGCVLGVLSTHYPDPRIPLDVDFALLDRIARRTAFWLEQATVS
jgi:hypothetical protein